MNDDGKPSREREPPRRRASDRGNGARKKRGFVERATAQGHSGSGSESVLPHLRDQLRLKALMPMPYPMPEPPHEGPGKDDLHQ